MNSNPIWTVSPVAFIQIKQQVKMLKLSVAGTFQRSQQNESFLIEVTFVLMSRVLAEYWSVNERKTERNRRDCGNMTIAVSLLNVCVGPSCNMIFLILFNFNKNL